MPTYSRSSVSNIFLRDRPLYGRVALIICAVAVAVIGAMAWLEQSSVSKRQLADAQNAAATKAQIDRSTAERIEREKIDSDKKKAYVRSLLDYRKTTIESKYGSSAYAYERHNGTIPILRKPYPTSADIFQKIGAPDRREGELLVWEGFGWYVKAKFSSDERLVEISGSHLSEQNCKDEVIGRTSESWFCKR